VSILVDSDTTFIVQGITGREAVNLTRECLDYGTGAKIVGGVTPGRKGREVHGVPVYDTVEQAVDAYGEPIDGSVVTVPPAFTKDAVFEAIENGIGLIVIVTERIPRRDVAQMVELATMRGARIIGPNCLGIIVPDVIKMGGIGGPAKNAAQAYSPGPIGVISRSGGMTTEMSSTLSAAGLGQSTAVSIGGDAIIGPSSCRSFTPTSRRRASSSTPSPGAAWRPSWPPGSSTRTAACRSWRSWQAVSWTRCRA
jgi:succinyl-CoA synthetase alpha subunit